jgi:hypothetical protein
VGHGLFLNFRNALRNYLLVDFKNINSVQDLCDIKTIFIIDEHFQPHINIWKNEIFIDELNRRGIKTIVFNFEKIYDALFPNNMDHQININRIENLVQFVSDMNDAKVLNKNTVNKQLLSRGTTLVQAKNKINEILFIGQTKPGVYFRRRDVLNNLMAKNLPLRIISSDRKLNYTEYLELLAGYKYILNPLGTGDFLNLRFYEALKMGSVPIQQVTDQMLERYTELNSGHSVNFKHPDELVALPNLEHKLFDYYLEDYFLEIDLKSYL